MIIPLIDNRYNLRKPLGTYLLVVVNTLIFLITFLDEENIFKVYGLIRSNIQWYMLFTHMFLHAGPFHLLGNMIYLWFFGRNIERKIGGIRFVIFYLLCGLSAAVLQLLSMPSDSNIPMVGASGAISGVLAMYLLFFKTRWIYIGYFAIFMVGTLQIPAYWLILLYFVVDLASALIFTMADVEVVVAHWAHVGGFVMGIIAIAITRLTSFKGYPEVRQQTAKPKADTFSEVNYIPAQTEPQSSSGASRGKDSKFPELRYIPKSKDIKK